MTRSLNPHVVGPSPPPAKADMPAAPRRNVLAAAIAVIVGGFVGFVPFAAGLATFLDPLFRRKKAGEGSAERQPIRVASLDALPADGTPVQVPVMADLTDAWNR